MFQQVEDFKAESDALYELLKPLSNAEFEQQTQFKDWTFNDILQHIHYWNTAVDNSLVDPDGFSAMMASLMQALQDTRLRDFEAKELGNLKGTALLDAYRLFCDDVCTHFGNVDPKKRVQWAGPDMSVRSSMTARQMETWAHGQAVYDKLGIDRVDTDRIKNIAVLGVNTFGWTFKNRGLDIPEPAPTVRLVAPSGENWEWNAPGDGNLIEGTATEFCQVVTQTRHVADTELRVAGNNAKAWMEIAQCFAGPPENPPSPGTRRRI